MRARTRSIRTTISALLTMAVVVGSGAVVLASSDAVDITRPRVEAAVGRGFANAAVEQGRLTGHARTRPVVTATTCAKGGASVPDQGPGRDWVCTVTSHERGDDATSTSRYEVNASTGGCLMATDPKLTAGHQFVRAAGDGGEVDNPLYQFDACFAVT